MKMKRKMKKLGIASALLMHSSLIFAQVPPPLSDPTNSGNWVINPEVSDEFNGNDIDRDVWWIQGENGEWNGQWRGRAPSEYDPDNVRVEGGYLFMTSKWDPSHNFSPGNGGGNSQGSASYGDVPITASALLGKNFFKYGYMEMRSKAADGPISSSYWTTGVNGETDSFESYGRNPNNPWSGRRFHSSFHDWRPGSPTFGTRIWENDHIFDFRVADDFHTYGFEWDPNYVAMYINGALVNCVSRAEMGNKWVATNEQRPWIDMETFDWEINANSLTAEDFKDKDGNNGIDFIVDYARVYQRAGGGSGGECPGKDRVNLLKNPSFENDMANWSGPAEIITSSTSDGNKAASLTSNGTIEQTVSVKPNTSYIVSAFANSVNTNEVDLWYNAFLGVRGHGNTQSDVRYFFPRWHEKSLQFTTGPNATEATIYFTNAPHGELTHIDEMALYEVDFTYVGDPVSGVSISPRQASVLQRGSIRLTPEVTPANAGNKALIWTSSDESIASVDIVGNVRAISPGTVTISAQSIDNSAVVGTSVVTVEPNFNLLDNGDFEKGSLVNWSQESFGLVGHTDDPANVYEGSHAAEVRAGASLKQSFSIKPSTTYRASAACRVDSPSPTKPAFFVIEGWEAGPWGIPMDAAMFSSYFNWSQEFTTSANDTGSMSIAAWNSVEVSEAGVPSHPQTIYCDDFEVRELDAADPEDPEDPVAATGVAVTPASDDVNVGATVQLAASVIPSNASNKSVTWSTQDAQIATVSAAGLVTGVNPGTVQIAVTSDDGGFTDTATITVSAVTAPPPPPPSSGIVANSGFEAGALGAWTSYGNVSVVSGNASSGSYAVSIDGNGAAEQVITVEPNTTYELAGLAKVGGASQNAFLGVKDFGGSEASHQFTSTAYTQGSLTFTTGANNTSARIYLWNGDSNQSAYGDDITVTKQSSNVPTTPPPPPPSDDDADCGAKWVPVTGVDIAESTLTMSRRERVSLNFSVLPSCASQQQVTFKSSNWDIVAPRRDGTLVATKRKGTATITVLTKDGQFTDVITVTVE